MHADNMVHLIYRRFLLHPVCDVQYELTMKKRMGVCRHSTMAATFFYLGSLKQGHSLVEYADV